MDRSIIHRATAGNYFQPWHQHYILLAAQVLLELRSGEVQLSKAITDIALQVGFSSQSYLTQQFKRLTPKQVR